MKLKGVNWITEEQYDSMNYFGKLWFRIVRSFREIKKLRKIKYLSYEFTFLDEEWDVSYDELNEICCEFMKALNEKIERPYLLRIIFKDIEDTTR